MWRCTTPSSGAAGEQATSGRKCCAIAAPSPSSDATKVPALRPLERALGQGSNGFVVGGSRLEAGCPRGESPGRDDDPASAGELRERAQRRQRHALDAGKDHHPVANVAERQHGLSGHPTTQNHLLVHTASQGHRGSENLAVPGEQRIVDEVEVVARLDHLADDVGAEALGERSIHADAAGRESRPGVAVGQVDENVISRLPLAQAIATPLAVARHLGHGKNHGLCALNAPAAYMRQPGPPRSAASRASHGRPAG